MENLLFLGVLRFGHISLIVMCLNIGTPNNVHIPFGTNEELVVLSVPILKHFKVIYFLFGHACISMGNKENFVQELSLPTLIKRTLSFLFS